MLRILSVLLCTDINECSAGIHSCDQDCVNNNGSFQCTCQDGYVLGGDDSTCEGNILSLLEEGV